MEDMARERTGRRRPDLTTALRDCHRLAGLEFCRIADAVAIAVTNLFPARGRLVELARNGSERVAGLHHVSARTFLATLGRGILFGLRAAPLVLCQRGIPRLHAMILELLPEL